QRGTEAPDTGDDGCGCVHFGESFKQESRVSMCAKRWQMIDLLAFHVHAKEMPRARIKTGSRKNAHQGREPGSCIVFSFIPESDS
ncbi:MAG: hypothetical protein ABTQ26_18975, partial [Azonexus sp.]